MTQKSLNTIRVPVSVLREIAIELMRIGEENIGLEDLMISIKARLPKNDVDKTT